MFRFIRPVMVLVILACCWVAAAAATDTYTLATARKAINAIQTIQRVNASQSLSIRQWLNRPDPGTQQLVHILKILAGLVFLMLVVRYFKETANTRMSMNMVFYIREAVYDKVQRVGFGFHDVHSSGQLINRALSDLQNVRAFVQTAVLVTLDIVLAVAFNIILIWTREQMGGSPVAGSAADLDLLHPAIQPEDSAGRQKRDGGGGPERFDHHGKHRRRSRRQGVRHRSSRRSRNTRPIATRSRGAC